MAGADRCVCCDAIVPEGWQVCPSCAAAYIMAREMGGGRDPDRIDGFLEVLGKAWKKVPDWRFFQLVCNLQRMIGSDGFYWEDDKAKEFIRSWTVSMTTTEENNEERV